MRTLYWLPEVERGCNAIQLLRVDWGAHGWAIEFQPGNATPGADGQPNPATFAPDPDLAIIGRTVRDVSDFSAWLEEQSAPLAPTTLMHFTVGLMRYLWMQHKGLRPAPVTVTPALPVV